MRFPPHILDEIRARLPVSEVVGRRVKLKKQGREWAGLSPFANEKTPSFFVNDQKGFYHDFSSGRHGDIFKFVQETEGLSFPEAVESLASLAGVSLPRESPEAAAQAEKRKDLYDATEAAAAYFESRLQTSEGAAARAYLTKRALSPAIQAEFRLGFAPDAREGLKTHLLAKGFTEQQLLDAGLTILPDDGRASYDRFRGRLMIPIQDAKGRVVAFGGRTLLPDGKPKYLNSSENTLFHKGSMVFNAHRARSAAHDAGTIVVVEGYMDAIAVFQAGFRAVVASLGTAFTEDQMATLWRFADEPVICFDGDKAGTAAAFRAIDRILPVLKTGKTFSFAFLPAGQDPDDLIKAGGLAAFQNALSEAKPLLDVLFQRETASLALERPEQRALLEKRLFELVRAIPDPTLLKHFQSAVATRLRDLFRQADRGRPDFRGADQRQFDRNMPENRGAGRFDERFSPRFRGRGTPFAQSLPKSIRPDDTEETLLGLLVEYPDLGRHYRPELARLHLRGHSSGISHDDLLHEILRLYDEEAPATPAALYNHAERTYLPALDQLHGRATEQLALGHALYARYGVLAHNPSGPFVERFLTLFCDKLNLRQGQDELKLMVEAVSDDPADFERISALRSELHLLQERIHSTEHELGEEAALYLGAAQAT